FSHPTQRAWLVIDMRICQMVLVINVVSQIAITLVSGDMCLGLIDWQLQIVSTNTIALRIRVREGAPLQHLVIGKVEAVNENASTKCGLFNFGEEVLGVPVEYHTTDRPPGKLFLGPQLGIV